MPDITPNLGLKKPLGNETVSRVAYNENLDLMDANAAKSAALAAHLVDLTAHATKAAVTYYVNAATGNDANDGLTAGTALATIQAAINKLPQIINHTATINVAAGTYAETVSIYGFSGKGTIGIIGGNSLSDAANYLVNKFDIGRCGIYILVQGFKANADSTTGEFKVEKGIYVEFKWCITLRATTYGFLVSGIVRLNNCQVSNHSYGVMGFNGAIACVDCIGSNNTVGVLAEVGCVVTVGGINTGGLGKRIRGTSVNETTANGGLIGPRATATDITIYVRTDGSDDNDGSANNAANALKTIQEAINRIPKRVEHAIVINIADGTYAETFALNGFVGNGTISITGNTTTPANVVVSNQAVIRSCPCRVTIEGITFPTTTLDAIVMYASAAVTINKCVVTGTWAGQGIYIDKSIVYITESTFSNKANGIYATFCSTVYSYNNAGTGNNSGLTAVGASTIGKSGTQPGGTLAETYVGGGVIR